MTFTRGAMVGMKRVLGYVTVPEGGARYVSGPNVVERWEQVVAPNELRAMKHHRLERSREPSLDRVGVVGAALRHSLERRQVRPGWGLSVPPSDEGLALSVLGDSLSLDRLP